MEEVLQTMNNFPDRNDVAVFEDVTTPVNEPPPQFQDDYNGDRLLTMEHNMRLLASASALPQEMHSRSKSRGRKSRDDTSVTRDTCDRHKTYGVENRQVRSRHVRSNTDGLVHSEHLRSNTQRQTQNVRNNTDRQSQHVRSNSDRQTQFLRRNDSHHQHRSSRDIYVGDYHHRPPQHSPSSRQRHGYPQHLSHNKRQTSSHRSHSRQHYREQYFYPPEENTGNNDRADVWLRRHRSSSRDVNK